MSRPMLVTNEDHAQPAPEALRVIEHLQRVPLRPGADIATIRQHYTDARRPLLPPLDPVESISTWNPEGQRPGLTVIRPFGSGKKVLAGLVYFHGGGWTVGGLDTYEPLCRKLANATGCAVIWVEYRLAPEHPFPAAFEDARHAYQWALANAGMLGLDPERIGVAGDSAGGNLAAAVCLAERDDRAGRVPHMQLLIYPCLDMIACMRSHKLFATGYGLTTEIYRWYRKNYAGGQAKTGHWRLSPLFAYSLEGLPPTVLLYAGFDILRDEAQAYAERLDKAGVPLETLYFPDMIHGFVALGGAIPAANAAIDRIADAIANLTRIDAPAMRERHLG